MSNRHKFQSQTHLEDEQEEQQDGDDDISIASSDVYNNSGSLQMPLDVKQSDPNISKVNGRTPFTKQKRKLLEPEVDVDFMNKLKEKLNSKKDYDQLYGDLLASKLRRLSSSSKLRTKHEIGNIMFKHMLQNEEDQQTNMSKLLQEIKLQVLRQPHWHLFRQADIINRINNRRINNR